MTFGDFEAICSAFSFAAGIIFMNKLVERQNSIEVSGSSLLISGLIFAAILIQRMATSYPGIGSMIVLVFFSLVPMATGFLYVIGISRIGASLTFRAFGIRANLPENILLAVIGDALGILGIYLIHVDR
ncbi:MAG TPA: EamA family transporter [Candidatus Bathyarchaeia archaeon]|nr:EamA family transporter [Candidatus Bathyarchaeia archaeon]